MPMKLSVGDHYASVMVIEVRPGAGEMGRPTGTMQVLSHSKSAAHS